MARIMICGNLPKSLGADVVNTVNYVLNRCLIGPIGKKTPYELVKGKKPNVRYFKVFKSKSFIDNNGKKTFVNLM